MDDDGLDAPRYAVELSAGTIEYRDTGGDGPVVVFSHGFPMTGTQWRRVVPLLPDCRCVLPTLPLGAHRWPMRPGTDLGHRGVAALLGEFLEALDLHDVTLVVNDWGGAALVVAEPAADRLARLVLVACEAFDNVPPPPARPLVALLRVPGGPWLATRLLALTPVRRHFGRALSLRGVPDDVFDEWLGPATRHRAIRRDLAAFATGTPAAEVLSSWTGLLASFAGPALVVWARNDRMMPRWHGPALAELLRRGRLVEIPDSATLVGEDQPDALADQLRAFLNAPV